MIGLDGIGLDWIGNGLLSSIFLTLQNSLDMAAEDNPVMVLLFSGKRKSGKDYITDRLLEKLGNQAVIIRLSGPLKERYAQDRGLDFQEMLSAGQYKEQHRLDMILWSEKIRKEDYTYFCRAAIHKYKAKEFPFWIVSDCRRETDLNYFFEQFGNRVKKIRIVAEDNVRKERGWVFTESVDDQESECGLDRISDWDLIIENNGASIENWLAEIQRMINSGE